MWPDLIIATLLAGIVALHLLWKRRFALLQKERAGHRKLLAQEQDQHSQTMAEKQAQQEALFNSMAEGVLVLDRFGRIELINQSLQRLLAPAADVRGQTILEAFR